MAHPVAKSDYADFTDRLNRFPQGAPPSKLLDKIPALLFSEKEARLVSLLPIRPFTAEKAAKIWKMSLADAMNVLDRLSSRVILVDMDQNGITTMCCPRPWPVFFWVLFDAGARGYRSKGSK